MSAGEDRRYWRERAMAVLPSATAREIVRAARVLSTWFDGPMAVYDARGSLLPADSLPRTDVRAFDGVTGGGVPDLPLAPSAYDARKHETRGDGTVGRRGIARVQGSPVALDDSPNGHSPALMCQMLSDLTVRVHIDHEHETMSIHPVVIGASAFDLLRLTHTFYAGSIPDLIGTDVMDYGHMVHAAPDADPYTARGVVGGESAQAKLTPWPTRTRLPMIRARRSELAGAPARALPAPAGDPAHLFIGYKLIPRGKVAARKPRTVKLERTVATITTTRGMLSAKALAAAEHLNRGERLVISCDGVTLTLTRGKSPAGKFGLGVKGGKRADGLETPAAVAAQALKLTA